MKHIIRWLLAVAIVCAMVIDGYLLFFRQSRVVTQTASSSSSAPSQSSDSSSISSAASSKQKYQNGSFTGKATSTQWGDVQVQAVIKA